MGGGNVGLLVLFVGIINIAAGAGLLYFVADRYTCLLAAYRLLRCLRQTAPETYRYLTWEPPFHWLFKASCNGIEPVRK